MEAETIKEVTWKLIGPTTPKGDSWADEIKATNAAKLLDLSGDLINEILALAQFESSPEASVAKIGRMAAEYLRALKRNNVQNVASG